MDGVEDGAAEPGTVVLFASESGPGLPAGKIEGPGRSGAVGGSDGPGAGGAVGGSAEAAVVVGATGAVDGEPAWVVVRGL